MLGNRVETAVQCAEAAGAIADADQVEFQADHILFHGFNKLPDGFFPTQVRCSYPSHKLQLMISGDFCREAVAGGRAASSPATHWTA